MKASKRGYRETLDTVSFIKRQRPIWKPSPTAASLHFVHQTYPVTSVPGVAIYNWVFEEFIQNKKFRFTSLLLFVGRLPKMEGGYVSGSGEMVTSLQNYIVSTHPSNFNENLNQEKQHITLTGQTRCLPPPAQGERWPSALYKGISNLKLLNPPRQ